MSAKKDPVLGARVAHTSEGYPWETGEWSFAPITESPSMLSVTLFTPHGHRVDFTIPTRDWRGRFRSNAAISRGIVQRVGLECGLHQEPLATAWLDFVEPGVRRAQAFVSCRLDIDARRSDPADVVGVVHNGVKRWSKQKAGSVNRSASQAG